MTSRQPGSEKSRSLSLHDINQKYRSRKWSHRCCPCCFRQKVMTEQQLTTLFEMRKSRAALFHKKSELQQNKYTIEANFSGESSVDPFSFDPNYGFESGYFPKRIISNQKKNITMADFRKTCGTTKRLPDPEYFIEQDMKRKTQLPQKPKKRVTEKLGLTSSYESNLTELNQMLGMRLSGSLTMVNRTTEESMEATESFFNASFRGASLDNAIIRRLFRTDSRRADSKVSVMSKKSLTKRKSAFVMGMESKNETDFLKNVTKTLENYLEHDWRYTELYVKQLDKYFIKSHKHNQRSPYVSKKGANWLAILYTTSSPTDEITNFRCLLTRFILQYYYVGYEERDIAVTKNNYQSTLAKTLSAAGIDYEVPFVFARGVVIGGCNIIYAIHKMKKVGSIFSSCIMQPATYDLWLHRPMESTQAKLVMKVNMSNFRYIKERDKSGALRKLTPDERSKITQGRWIIQQGQVKWVKASSKRFVPLCMRTFALIRSLLIRCYTLLDNLYAKVVLLEVATLSPQTSNDLGKTRSSEIVLYKENELEKQKAGALNKRISIIY